MRLRASAFSALSLAFLGGATACVHVYEPLSGLHRPTVVDIQAPNFRDLRLRVDCEAGEFVSAGEARLLCDRVGKLFENQGATVTTSTERGLADAEPAELPAEGGQAAPAPAPTTDLVLELRAQQLHTSNDPISWILCIATATIVPAVTESTFVQEVVVRDGTGFLLATDRLEGRIVRTAGIGTFLGNKILDWVARPKEEELSGKAVHADLSNDLYRQLSQDVFNAEMRWKVLQEATPDGRATAAPAGGTPP